MRSGVLGLTVMELMIVLAIIGGATFLMRSGFRALTKADLVENSTELAAVLKRASQLAVEHAQLHRVVLDLDKGAYSVEVCEGETAIQRNELIRPDDEAKKRALALGKDKLQGGNDQSPNTLLGADPETAAQRSLAIAGHHVADKTCVPVPDPTSGDATGKGFIRQLRVNKGIKFKEVWVQHRDESVTKGQIAIYFFPLGSSEKAVIEVTDGDEIFSILVYGLTGRVELRDGTLRDVNDHMMKNVMGDHDAKREDQQ
ncbi:MAG TPA: type II secretion system protein [Kofleriaceae bacterium]|nr:type II secretion system protein [Kofleriaceae bacterium]